PSACSSPRSPRRSCIAKAHVPLPMTARILIVEDDADLVNLATHWLERAGYAVEHAGDGAAALALLDVMLPKIDGFELLRLIRSNSRTKELPVAMVTSFSRDKDAKRGRD